MWVIFSYSRYVMFTSPWPRVEIMREGQVASVAAPLARPLVAATPPTAPATEPRPAPILRPSSEQLGGV